MDQLSDYVRAPRELIRTGPVLVSNLYLYMPLNGTILHYRRRGDVLTPEDVAGLQKIPPENILIPASEHLDALATVNKGIAQALSEGAAVNGKEIREGAGAVLGSLDQEQHPKDTTSPGEHARKMLDTVSDLVEELISEFKSTPSAQAYEKVLAKVRESADPLANHHRQVSALAVLILLTAGGESLDEISDLGAAGLIHDLALRGMPRIFWDKHSRCETDFSPAEKVTYMRHPQAALEILAKEKFKTTPAMLRIVEHHHENWGGTGFKGLQAPHIYRPARALRIADDLVGLINHPHKPLVFRYAVKKLVEMERASGEALYDPDMIRAITAVIG